MNFKALPFDDVIFQQERFFKLRRILALSILAFLLIVIGIPILMVRHNIVLGSVKDARSLEASVAIDIFINPEGMIQTMPLEEYIKGVVAAEMPASFHLEALKAQAVVARTYAVRRMRVFGGNGSQEHPGADISADPAQGQAWISKKQCREKWGILGYLRFWPKIETAVEDTKGLIIVQGNHIIDPVYHSTCGGHTENSEDVWSGKEPYLRAKECPYDGHSPYFGTIQEIPFSEIASRLGIDSMALAAAAQGKDVLVKVLGVGEGGHVRLVKIGEKEMTGNEFRLALGLKSSRFTCQATSGKLRFVTDGYGHGVGLCQYGADGMASRGYGFRGIIEYYFTGVRILPMYRE